MSVRARFKFISLPNTRAYTLYFTNYIPTEPETKILITFLQNQKRKLYYTLGDKFSDTKSPTKKSLGIKYIYLYKHVTIVTETLVYLHY